MIAWITAPSSRTEAPVADPIDRRKFLGTAATLALLGGASITLGCTGSNNGVTPPPPPPPPPGGPSDVVGTVETNHGHTMRVSGSYLNATGEVTIEMQGATLHKHSVTLSPAQLAAIRAGTRVQVASTESEFGPEGPHDHIVVFN